jgi:hypothetical protein
LIRAGLKIQYRQEDAMNKTWRGVFFGLCAIIVVLALTSTGNAEEGGKEKVKVTGVELEKRGAEGAAFAGYNPDTGCAWMNTYFEKDSKIRISFDCWMFTGTSWGTYSVDGDKLCLKWDNPQIKGGCYEIYKIGEEKFERRLKGKPQLIEYRLN